MTVKGDLEALLLSKFDIPIEEGNRIIKAIFDCLDDPDFAFKYAKFSDEDTTKALPEYWNVIAFIQTLSG